MHIQQFVLTNEKIKEIFPTMKPIGKKDEENQDF